MTSRNLWMDLEDQLPVLHNHCIQHSLSNGDEELFTKNYTLLAVLLAKAALHEHGNKLKSVPVVFVPRP